MFFYSQIIFVSLPPPLSASLHPAFPPSSSPFASSFHNRRIYSIPNNRIFFYEHRESNVFFSFFRRHKSKRNGSRFKWFQVVWTIKMNAGKWSRLRCPDLVTVHLEPTYFCQRGTSWSLFFPWVFFFLLIIEQLGTQTKKRKNPSLL